MWKQLALFLASGAVAALASGPSSAETLQEALASAYRANPTLLAQRARLRSVNEQVPQALSGWRPTVRAFGDAGYRRTDQNDSRAVDVSSDLFNRRFGASVEQPVFRGGRTLAATRAAEHTVLAQRARLTSAEQAVLFDAVSAYVDVYRDQSVLDLTVRNEQRLARQLEATKDRFKVGEVTRTDVFQAEARLARATAERIQAEGQLEVSRATYRNVVGELPGGLVRPVLPEPLPPNLKSAISGAGAGNPDIRAAEYIERASLDNVDQVRGELLPTVSVVGTVEREYDAVREDSRFDTFDAFVSVDVPLYQAGATYSRMRAAKQSVIEQRRLVDQANRDAVEAATQSWNNLETARAAIVSFRKQVEANAVALEGVQREAEVGSRTVLDVLDAEQELLDSEVSLVRSQRDEIVAAYDLLAAQGRLTAESLGLAVDLYDPEQHYREVRGNWFGGVSQGDSSADFPAPRIRD
jgi:TolC family type I secretion outer membrane protein